MLRPGQQNPAGEIELSDGLSRSGWTLKLDGSQSAIEMSTVADDSLALYIRSVGKRYGDFDEQRTWDGGAGIEYLSSSATGFWDSRDCWTLSPNQLVLAPQQRFSSGYRVESTSMPGASAYYTWEHLIGENLYVSREFTPTADLTADKVYIWLRRVGNPSPLTLELRSDSAGSPSTEVLKTIIKTTSNITDLYGAIVEFDWSGTQALASGVKYHLVLTATSTDSAASHWEVLASTESSYSKTSRDNAAWTTQSWSMYYRVTDADSLSKKWYFFHRHSENSWPLFCAVSSDDSDGAAASKLYQWDETNDVWEEKTSTGLTQVSSAPIVVNGIVYFPQGEDTNIRKWNGTSFEDDASNKASFLCIGVNDEDGSPQIWRANTTRRTVASVSRSDLIDYDDFTDDLSFGDAIEIGEKGHKITGLLNASNTLYVFKEDGAWAVSGDVPVQQEWGMSSAPSSYNGLASAFNNQYIYFSWMFSTERLFNDTVDDIGLGWRTLAPENGLEAFDSCYEAYIGWLFVARDAGTSGTSGVAAWDGLAWHNIARGYCAGKRIRNVKVQVVSGARSRLWFDCGGDMMYVELPLNKPNPTFDTSFNYQPEGYIVSSIIDMGTASDLAKYISSLTVFSRNLGTYCSVEMDYHVDEDCGEVSLATDWTTIQPVLSSPEDYTNVNIGDIRKFQYRMRLSTKLSTKSPVIKGVVPTGFARSPYKKVWHLRIKVGDTIAPNGAPVKDPTEFMNWLFDTCKSATRLRMTSIYPIFHDKWVVLGPPTIHPTRPQRADQDWKGSVVLTIVEA